MSEPIPSDPLVLVVDDEPDLRTLYELTLLRQGYRVVAAETLAQAWQHLERQRFDAVITDMRLPDGLGLTLLQGMNARQREERCIMITAYGSAENAVEALKAGAFDYLTKPVDLKQFRAVVASAIENTRAASQAAARPAPSACAESGAPAGTGQSALDRLVGDSVAIRTVKQRIVKVARSMAPVLVHGESGTGKELVARALHATSHRADGPFVAVNCSAIPEALLEAEFFGARKGSYTGATQDRDGFFQAAQGGTLFLDEIGDLPLAMQAKLLRAIQERSVRPLGSAKEETVDVRIVSATHKNLAAEVQTGRFRQDLYYRLNVIELVIPPLRERLEDLPALCEALLQRIGAETGLPPPPLSVETLRQIGAHPLPGNVRELENLLHRAVALGDGDRLYIDPPATPQPPREPAGAEPTPSHQVALPPLDGPLPANLEAWLDQQERGILLRTLQETGFNRTAAAARLGLNLRQIRYRMSRLHITAPPGVGAADDAS